MISWRIRAHGRFQCPACEPPAKLAPILAQSLARRPRRINRYTQLALIGAHRCTAGLSQPLPAHTPLYLASQNAGIADTVAQMDGILFEHTPPTPVAFVNLAGNMAGFYTAASLALAGHNMTVSRYVGAFGAMLELADLDDDRSQAMLLGLVCEVAWPLSEHRYRRGLAPDVPLAESSYWLVVDDRSGDAQLLYATTGDAKRARQWLADGDYWAVDPQLSSSRRRSLRRGLAAERAWPGVPTDRGHPDALVGVLFAALERTPVPRLRLVARNAFGGFQLLGLSPWA